MVLFTLFASVASVLFTLVTTTPVDLGGLSPQARDIISRSTPAAPRFVVYSDQYVSYDSLPATTDLTVCAHPLYLLRCSKLTQGFNVLYGLLFIQILTFLTLSL